MKNLLDTKLVTKSQCLYTTLRWVPLQWRRLLSFIAGTHLLGLDSAVGIVTRYWLNSLGIESWWGRDIPHLSRLALGPTHSPVKWVLSLFHKVKESVMPPKIVLQLNCTFLAKTLELNLSVQVSNFSSCHQPDSDQI